mgnify:CR=1 FL=1
MCFNVIFIDSNLFHLLVIEALVFVYYRVMMITNVYFLIYTTTWEHKFCYLKIERADFRFVGEWLDDVIHQVIMVHH